MEPENLLGRRHQHSFRHYYQPQQQQQQQHQNQLRSYDQVHPPQEFRNYRFPATVNINSHQQQNSSNHAPSLNLNHNHMPIHNFQNPRDVQQQIQVESRRELQMAYQDAAQVCNPDFTRPFTDFEDACERLLPYHVVASYEEYEVDDANETRQQQWDKGIEAKLGEFTSRFEKQVHVFNMLNRGQAKGDFRTEEKLIIMHDLLKDEKDQYRRSMGLNPN